MAGDQRYFGQDNPGDQLIAIAAALDGDAMNLEEDLGTPEQIARRLARYAEDLRIISDHLQGVEWKEDDRVSFLSSRGTSDSDGDPVRGILRAQDSSVAENEKAEHEGKDLTCPSCGEEVFDVEDFCDNCGDDYRGSFAEAADCEGVRIAQGDDD